DLPVIFSDNENRWIHIIPEDYSLNLISWITTKEDDGWNIQWPTADSSIKATELHSELIKRNLSSLDSHGKKLKKED
ncbi:hypothetical protein ABK046_53135, partial [Streptomyces caeruleatus]